MSIPKGKLVTVDIGASWTKVFLIDHDRGNKLQIASSASLPTSSGDLKFAVDLLFEKLEITPKENIVLVTSVLDEAQVLAQEYKAIFVPVAEVKKNLLLWLKDKGYPNCKIFDAGSDFFSSDYKASQVGSFLSFSLGETELENHLANKALHPFTLAETPQDVEIEQAMLRVSFEKLEGNLSEASNVLLTGSLIGAAPKLSRLVLVVLDVLGTYKVAEVLADRRNFAASWGAALTKYRELLDFDIDFIEKLGSLVSLGGPGTVGLDYGLKNVQEVRVQDSEIALLPASEEQKVQISFQVGKETRKVEAAGGVYGVLIDGRAKPLKLVFGQASSQKAMIKWEEAIEKVEMIK